MVLLTTLLGCRRGPPDPAMEDWQAPTELLSERVSVEGPIAWMMDRPPGLCLAVPAGWSGTTGPAPMVLELMDPQGVWVSLSVSRVGFAAERDGWELLFDDPGAYRAIPLLVGGGTRSWQAVDPSGPLIQAWYGEVNGFDVEVLARYPLGTSTLAGERVRTILRSLCTTS